MILLAMKKFFILILASVCFLACEKAPEEIAVSSVSLSQATAEMIIGETVQLTASVQPSNATDKSIVWASSKQSVATVSSSGVVTAIAEGTSTVTASAGGKSATCTITVSKKVVEVSSIELDRTELSLEEEQSVTLIATVKPDDATDKTVLWTSSDTAIATVDDSGKVTGIKEGTATIRAKAGDKQATCAVTVAKMVIAVESISLNKNDLNLEKGKSETLIATVKPDNATDKTVTWSSSDDAIATVEQTGKVLAIGGGEATITVQAGEKTATCKVTVTVPVESISLDNTSLTLEEGQSTTLVATVKPDDASDKTVAWSSSDEKIATVENGKVSAIKEGSVTITAAAGDKKATCKVTVQKKIVAVASVSLSQTAITLYEGQSTTLVATVKPDDATNKTVTWSSSASEIASVDQEGKVSAIKAGSATITASAGDYSATCTVTVEKNVIAVTSITLNKSFLSLLVGETETLIATVLPDNATDKTVTWNSEDDNVAIVKDGKVTAVSAGETKISAKAGNKTAECRVTVEAPAPPTNHFAGTKWGFLDGPVTWTFTFTDSEVIFDYLNTVSGTPTKEQFRDPYTYTETTVSFTLHVWSGIAFVLTGTLNGSSLVFDDTGIQNMDFTMYPFTDVTSITLNQTSINLGIGESRTLIATVTPANATYETVIWRTSDDNVATVSSGVVTAVAEGTCTITALAGDKTATCAVTVTQPGSGPEAVDLGLSVKWASYNLGASRPEEHGDYYAWGEMETKSNYNWETYKWCGGSSNSLVKYCTDSKYGQVDNKTVLDLEDDIAHSKLGGEWRIPTKKEWEELQSNCSWEWTSNFNDTGVSGVILRSRIPGHTEKSVFLPVTGIMDDMSIVSQGLGMYWLSTLNVGEDYYAQMIFGSLVEFGTDVNFVNERCKGLAIRPVSE